nr:TetR/AcrR family transcriptional regulator [Pseudonocardia acaciae]
MTGRPYHHGDLRRALLDAAVAAIEQDGAGALSLRAVARRAEVSHAAPTHHFGDKAGLLTAVAVQGYELLHAALTAAARSGGFTDVGVAYVRFAGEHPAHFAVMFRPELLHDDDPELVAARDRAGEPLLSGAGDRATATAAWSLVHGLATLLRHGVIAPAPNSSVEDLARVVTRKLRLD